MKGSNVVAVSHTDGLGSVRAITDGNGNVTQTYRTDAFGQVTSAQGGSLQPFGYAGAPSDPESGGAEVRYDERMKRATISISDDLAACLRRESQRTGDSASDIARRALSAYFGLDGSQPRRLPFAALGKSGFTHMARDIEEILAEEWSGTRGR